MEIFGVFLVNQSSGNTISLLPEQENLIGRGVPNPQGEKGRVLLPHPSISKFHAKIVLKPQSNEWILHDTSRHGIWVNDKKVDKEIKLNHGDKIKVGPFILMFYEKFKADDETSEQPLPSTFTEAPRQSRVLVYILAVLVLEMLLMLLQPLILMILGSSMVFFSLIFLLKSSWRQKVKISIWVLLTIFLLGSVGMGLALLKNYQIL